MVGIRGLFPPVSTGGFIHSRSPENILDAHMCLMKTAFRDTFSSRCKIELERGTATREGRRRLFFYGHGNNLSVNAVRTKFTRNHIRI